MGASQGNRMRFIFEREREVVLSRSPRLQTLESILYTQPTVLLCVQLSSLYITKVIRYGIAQVCPVYLLAERVTVDNVPSRGQQVGQSGCDVRTSSLPHQQYLYI